MKFALANGEDEAHRGGRRGAAGLSWLCLHAGTRGCHLAQTDHGLHLLGGVVLVPAEDVGLGAFGVAELVYLSLVCVSNQYVQSIRSSYHCAICDQTNKGVCGQQAQAHDDGVLERLQAVLLLARVDDENEDGSASRGLGEAVLDGGTARVQLGRDLFLGDVLVVWRELVAVEAERAYPDAGAHIDLTEGFLAVVYTLMPSEHTSMG